jgi:hypothetical protein
MGDASPEGQVDLGEVGDEPLDVWLIFGHDRVEKTFREGDRLASASIHLCGQIAHFDVGTQPKKCKGSLEHSGGISGAPLQLQDQDLLTWERTQQVRELPMVKTAGDCCGDHGLVNDAATLGGVSDTRAEPLDRIAQQYQELCLGRGLAQQRRRPRIEHVTRRPFAAALLDRSAELAVIGVDLSGPEFAGPESIEEMQFLGEGAPIVHVGMVVQKAVPPRCARTLHAHSNEVRGADLPSPKHSGRTYPQVHQRRSQAPTHCTDGPGGLGAHQAICTSPPLAPQPPGHR